jgi:hypothetical protein
MEKRRKEIHCPVCDEERASRPGCWRREVFVEFRIKVELVLYEPCQVRTEYACFVCCRSWFVIADRRILTECHTYTNDLCRVSNDAVRDQDMSYFLSHILQMLLDQVVASGVIQGKETPRISECDQMRFSWEELDVQNFEQCNLLACNRRLVYAIPQRGLQHCPRKSIPALLLSHNLSTYKKSTPRTSSGIFSFVDRP